MPKLYEIEIFFDDATGAIFSSFTEDQSSKILDVFQTVGFFGKPTYKRYRIKGNGQEYIINLTKVKYISVKEIEKNPND